jgi:hypothetical protein
MSDPVIKPVKKLEATVVLGCRLPAKIKRELARLAKRKCKQVGTYAADVLIEHAQRAGER